MQLAHHVWEGRLTIDRAIVEERLLTKADRAVRLFELLRNLVYEVVLLGYCNWRCP